MIKQKLLLKMKKNRILLTVFIAMTMTLSNCSNDDEKIDNIAPTISIQSPDLNQTYSVNIDNMKLTEIVGLKAQAIDDTKILSIKVTVTNSNGIVVLEKTRERNIVDSETLLDIYENFSTTNKGIYNAVFTATDESGNIETSTPRTFEYID
jgi:hypothetical protein